MSSFTASSFLFKIFPINGSPNAGKNRTKHLSTYDTFQPQPAECMIFKSELFSSDDDNSHPSRLHPIQYSMTLGGTTSGGDVHAKRYSNHVCDGGSLRGIIPIHCSQHPKPPWLYHNISIECMQVFTGWEKP